MKKRFVGQEKNCLLCGIATWLLFFLSMFLMALDALNLFVSYVLAVLWGLTSLGAVILAIGIRCGIGVRKNGAVRWGMVLGTAMLMLQSFVISLLIFQEKLKWESMDAGLISLCIAVFVVAFSTFLYLFSARRAQARLEGAKGRKGDRV